MNIQLNKEGFKPTNKLFSQHAGKMYVYLTLENINTENNKHQIYIGSYKDSSEILVYTNYSCKDKDMCGIWVDIYSKDTVPRWKSTRNRKK